MKYIELSKKIEKINKDYVSKKELYEIFKHLYEDSSEKTFMNAISIMKHENKITGLNEKYYSIIKKKIYKNYENKEINKIYKTIDLEYPNIEKIVWNTNIINEFTLHYAINNYTIVETEKIAIDVIINLLKEKFLNKYTIITEEILNKNKELYTNSEKLLIVKPLHVKSPLRKKNREITLEKILVDIYKDELYIQYQGNELKTIYENVFNEYEINLKKLLSYAKYRTDIKIYREYINSLNIPKKYKLKEK